MDILGVGKNTVYRLLNSGQLPAIRIGRSWKINLLSLSALFPILQAPR
ncbi:helix-turn-helix domain-containing protein [Flavonifractor plautii]|nr:helix-turn-helix domain-containing protein [Flavonifractor plautii]MCG4705170.1 helix-turn-helix domain-containing protein [Flavonifractor plautii]MDB7866402.1 helix-turn-helix domain-containing protein [Flavonifractor plautii]MDB7870434.1 helix-turn-helix domain-containing protein [Flavonifractor plautii]MDB7885905.1 helix-turn-helix domain-containing protein [Flavonifractor plautii]MDB7954638.1 helix-turn-helix domain-containing protein [Flavonifractor plautii]